MNILKSILNIFTRNNTIKYRFPNHRNYSMWYEESIFDDIINGGGDDILKYNNLDNYTTMSIQCTSR